MIGSGLSELGDAKKRLETKGYDVIMTADGRQALGIFFDFDPNLVICDDQASGLSGTEVCQLLKENVSGSSAVFIILIDLPSDAKLAAELKQKVKADDYIGRPCNVEDITGKVSDWLRIDAQKKARIEHKKERKFNIPTEGQLADYPFARLLFFLYDQRFDGQLRLREDAKKISITFHLGDPVNITSNFIREDSLGTLLLKEKQITEIQLEKAGQKLKVPAMKLGEALVGMDLITPKELTRYLQRHRYEKLLSVFRPSWKKGFYLILPGSFYFEHVTPMHVSTITLIQDGIARYYDLDRLLPIFQNKDRMNRVCRATPEIEHVLGKMKLGEPHLRVADHLRRGMKIKDLEVMVQMPRPEFFQFLYTLLMLRSVRITKSAPAEMEAAAGEEIAGLELATEETEASPQRASLEYNRNFYTGKTYFEAGNFRQASQFLQHAIANNPDCAESLAMLGWCEYMLNHHQDFYVADAAKEYLHKAIIRSPACAKAYLYLAKIHKAENDESQTERYARQAYHFDPKDPEIRREFELAKMRRRHQHD